MANWRGIKGITFIDNGCWSDWEIAYKGYIFTGDDIEGALWARFLDETGHKDHESGNDIVEKEFTKYCMREAKPYLEDCIWGKCYKERL